MAPIHVAIIMDGNGRWARSRGHARYFGHVRGAERVREVVEAAVDLELGALTLYAFSTENWKRSEMERSILWSILRKYLQRELVHLLRKNVQLKIIGDRTRLAPDLLEVLEGAEKQLAQCTGLKLTLAISYGSRHEIVRAAQKFARDCVEGRASPSHLDEQAFAGLLETGSMGALSDVDLVLRTSGEQRLSNFLLWQSAYAELMFIEKSWPDFTGADLLDAVRSFSGRERRFGQVDAAQQSASASTGVVR